MTTPNLSAEVATKIMGWKESKGGYFWKGTEIALKKEYWNPDKEIVQAFEIVEKLRPNQWIILESYPDGWIVRIQNKGKLVLCSEYADPSLPLAIVKAALAAVEGAKK